MFIQIWKRQYSEYAKLQLILRLNNVVSISLPRKGIGNEAYKS